MELTEGQKKNLSILEDIAKKFPDDKSYHYDDKDEESALIIFASTGNPTEEKPTQVKHLGKVMGNEVSLKHLIINSLQKNQGLKKVFQDAMKEIEIRDSLPEGLMELAKKTGATVVIVSATKEDGIPPIGKN